MINYLKILIFFFLSSATAQGSSSDVVLINILNQVQELYSGDVYGLASKYTLYRGLNSQEVDESYDAYLIKKDSEVHSRINNTEFLFFAKANIKINHDQKRFDYEALTTNSVQNKTIDIASYLTYFKERLLEKEGGIYKITLTATAITALPYGKVELYVDRKTYEVKKQVLYYLDQVAFKDARGSIIYKNPRLEITYGKIDLSPVIPEGKFDLSSYVNILNNNASGVGSLAGYKSTIL